jgi:hypothetical protein
MRNTALDRRLRKLETVVPTDDPRCYLGRSIDEWPDAALERVASMSDQEYAVLLEGNCGNSLKDRFGQNQK